MGFLIKGIKQLCCKCFVTLGIKIQVKEVLVCDGGRGGLNVKFMQHKLWICWASFHNKCQNNEENVLFCPVSKQTFI
jgi:hypothetical protein